MGQAGIFSVSKGTKVILAITLSVSLLAVFAAYLYYGDLNKREDPRIRKAKEFLVLFEKESGKINTLPYFYLLDSANAIFRSVPDYKTSFEPGLIYNNKCSSLLMVAIYDSTANREEKNILLDIAMKYCDSSIVIYKSWISDWEKLSYEEIAERISVHMNDSDKVFEGLNFRRIFEKRVKDIIAAQIETPRRLSVSLTNKGTIYRHQLLVDSALSCYNKSLLIWKDNRTAKSNLSVLMGGEPVKPSIIESLFPPDKNKK